MLELVIRWRMDFTVEEFLTVASQFQLSGLDTEAYHPLTLLLSEQAQQGVSPPTRGWPDVSQPLNW